MSGLTPDVLAHALAFRGQTAQLMQEAMEEVGRLSAGGEDSIEPPMFFSKPGLDLDNLPIKLKSISAAKSDRGLDFPEAVAARVLLSESQALDQALGQSFELSARLIKVLKLERGQLSDRAISGFAEFGEGLRSVQIVRNLAKYGGGKPSGAKVEDHLNQRLFDKFAGPLKNDNWTIGENCAGAIISGVVEQAEQLAGLPRLTSEEGEKEAKQMEISSRAHGAKLAADLYLEVKALATRSLLFGGVL